MFFDYNLSPSLSTSNRPATKKKPSATFVRSSLRRNHRVVFCEDSKKERMIIIYTISLRLRGSKYRLLSKRLGRCIIFGKTKEERNVATFSSICRRSIRISFFCFFLPPSSFDFRCIYLFDREPPLINRSVVIFRASLKRQPNVIYYQ